jgi:hypothetical protein
MRTRLLFSLVFTSTSLIACDGDGSLPPDAPKDIGFTRPIAPLKANMEMSEDNWIEIGAADLACLGTAANDPPTTVEVMATATVKDFQSGGLVPNTSVTVFPNQSIGQPFQGSPFMADGNAVVTVRIPVGTKRFGYKMTIDTALDTLLLNQRVNPAMAMQMVGTINSVSKTTAQVLPSLIGVSRTIGTGVLAGAMRDCQDREISNFIATVSTTKGTVTHAAGADTYYFDDKVGLPVRHTQRAHGSKNGLFMVIELAPAPTAFVQVWGYKTDADLAADNLTLIAELETQVIADTVITGSYEPLRTP